MSGLIASALQLVGLVAIVAAAFVVSITLGIACAGVAAVLVGLAIDRG